MPYQRQPNIQGGGFYNPYSDKPNFGAGVSGIIRESIMLQKQKEQEQQEQQRYEDEQEALEKKRLMDERRLKAYEQQVEDQGKPKLKDKSAFKEKYDTWLEILGPNNKEQAALMAQNFRQNRTTEEELALFAGKEEIRYKYDKLGGKNKLDDYPLIKDVLSDVNKRVKALTSDKYTLDDFVGFQMRGEPIPAIGKNSKQIANLIQMADYVSGLKIKAFMGDLTPTELNGIFQIASNMSKVEKIGIHKIIEDKIVDIVEDANKLAGNISEEKVPPKTEVMKGPDGKEYVNVGGKWYTLTRKQK